jgi:ethanolamine utilization protein EutJ
LAGSLKISYEEAEKIKTDRTRTSVIFPIVLPVIDKISSIVSEYLQGFDEMEEVCLVGGTCELDGLTEVVGKNLGIATFRPEVPQVVTPFGIALSCLGGNGGCAPH